MTGIFLLGAAGAFLFFTGLPVAARVGITQRLKPYVHGVPSSSHRARAAFHAAAKLLSAESDEELQRRLEAAGRSSSPADFRLEQFSAAVLCALVAWGLLAIAAISGIAVDVRALPALGIVAAATGYLGRDWRLGRLIENRRRSVADDLPTVIDLVTLAIMAGESIHGALSRASHLVGGPLGEELSKTVGEMRAGSSTVDALEALRSRIGEPSLNRFVDALVTGIEKGSPLADVLRAQADDAREARRRHLLELGGRREIAMLVPVVFLIMPVVVAFALLPGLVSLDLLVP